MTELAWCTRCGQWYEHDGYHVCSGGVYHPRQTENATLLPVLERIATALEKLANPGHSERETDNSSPLHRNNGGHCSGDAT